MKAGTESKTKLRIAIGLCVIAVLTVAWVLTSGGAPKPESAPVAAASPAQIRASYADESLDPRLRLDLLANSENIQYEGKGTNIFRERAEPVNIPKPVRQPLIDNHDPSKPGYTPPAPPPPPPINLKYFGMTSSKDEKPKAFLSQGDDVWIAREGDVVNRHYKIVRISPTAVEVEDLLNNNRQSIPRSQG
jgi:hypothetical protein